MRGVQTPMQVSEGSPLDVYVHCGPDGAHGLYSRDNRRLLAFLAFQVSRRDELMKVRCIVRDSQSGPHGQRWQDAYAGTTGLSIRPRRGVQAAAQHRGTSLFSSGERAIGALRKIMETTRDVVVQKLLNDVMPRLSLRSSSVARSERSLTVVRSSPTGRRSRSRSRRPSRAPPRPPPPPWRRAPPPPVASSEGEAVG